jgi:ribulose-phosphate 3-epimerase
MQSSMPKIAASILAADISYLAHEVQDAINSGTDWLHIDVMDGSFVPPITFGDNVVAALKKGGESFLDVHLMIEAPEKHFEAFAKAGADLLTIHQETCPHLHRSLSAIKSLGMQCGVAINPGTPVESILPVLDVVDLVLVMTVNPGWGGQPFLPSCLTKIERIANVREAKGYTFDIEVDGGVQPETAKLCLGAGTDVFVAGSYIFKAQSRKDAIQALRDVLESGSHRIN